MVHKYLWADLRSPSTPFILSTFTFSSQFPIPSSHSCLPVPTFIFRLARLQFFRQNLLQTVHRSSFIVDRSSFIGYRSPSIGDWLSIVLLTGPRPSLIGPFLSFIDPHFPFTFLAHLALLPLSSFRLFVRPSLEPCLTSSSLRKSVSISSICENKKDDLKTT